MELNTEVGAADMANTLVAAIVGVDKELGPAFGQGAGVDGETVVLRSDVALARDHAGTGDVVTAVTELHLLGLGTGRAGDQLVTQTDTKDRGAALIERLGQVFDGFRGHDGVTGSVRNEQTIVVLARKGREIVVPGDDQDFDTASQQTTQLVELQADVQAQHADRTARGVFEGLVLGGRVEFGFLNGDCRLLELC